ncbi:MurR/RpiR family transcriptional regulator [Burkholderia multivorans]|jgi:DNA-binding MurR/RpiR family transcriptional regulator|uniref:RpiR family transcriptional regulator n=2 Tax=Burkholderia multivorans TaxID=87883 RepID=A0A0H3KN39_BURM1|nr:MurR/RpiR family transcriptional regulator [Burkholderia multivorans]ABX17377.1 transcriptional regulator, RpiR family [Burkholderia multivorans ATCC 17616]AIO72542.1 SIS domain protein [Burkholderia multivorans]AOK65485.1 DNA-binding protein [Burkholderia multivorans]AYY56866.1 MurR/RpiR family transcriptional regulator [Burkholderia multivorans]AYZ01683.1 MurR/RpiR family transcriptional regulator [Burkholderia multivorans]
MADNFDELASRIRAQFSELSPQFQAGAAFLLDHPEEVAMSSMRKVAQRAQVQPASLVRLAQQFGFPGWNELRDLCVARVRTRPEPLTQRARSLVRPDAQASLAHDLLAAQQQNLVATAAHNEHALADAAKLIRKASHVHVAGFRSCYPVAFGFVYGYRLFRPSVSLLNGVAGSLEMELRAIGKHSATVIVSFAPYSAEATRVAQAAKAQGSRVVAITDSAVSPIALHADAQLIFTHDSPSFFPSLVAAHAVAEALVAQLLALEGGGAIAQLERAEAELHAKGAYVV